MERKKSVSDAAWRQIEQYGTPFYLYQFDRETTNFDDIYNETKVKEYKSPKKIKGFVYHYPNEEVMNEAGMTKDDTDILVKMSSITLKKAGLLEKDGTPKITQDDIMKVKGVNYDIKKVKEAVHLMDHHLIYVGGKRMGK